MTTTNTYQPDQRHHVQTATTQMIDALTDHDREMVLYWLSGYDPKALRTAVESATSARSR